jgi:hypothetical protein
VKDEGVPLDKLGERMYMSCFWGLLG